MRQEDEEVDRAKDFPPDLGRYLLSKSKPPIPPLEHESEDDGEDGELNVLDSDPDDGWTPDPDRPFSNALYHYGSQRWEEARSAFEEALQKIEVSQQVRDTENLDLGHISALEAVPEPEQQSEQQSEARLVGSSSSWSNPSSEDYSSTHLRARCHNGIGLCWMMQSRFSDGLASFDRAIAADPRAPSAYHNRAKALRELGREEEAENDEMTNKKLVEQEAVEPKGWLRIERGVKVMAVFHALRAQLAMSQKGERVSLLDALNSEADAPGETSEWTDNGEDIDELDGEDPIEIKEVVGYKGAQHAFSEAIRLDPDGDMVPAFGDSHEKLLLQAQLGPIMEIGSR